MVELSSGEFVFALGVDYMRRARDSLISAYVNSIVIRFTHTRAHGYF